MKQPTFEDLIALIKLQPADTDLENKTIGEVYTDRAIRDIAHRAMQIYEHNRIER